MAMTNLAPQWKIYGNTDKLQEPYDVSVVMPSIGRRELLKALGSIFEQNVNRIQVLIGIDKPDNDLSFLNLFLVNCPKNVTVNVIYPGYSTSIRHGGITKARDGGALRSFLTQAANSKYIAYLDDDNWWSKNHLEDLLLAIKNKAWAFSLRYFVYPLPETRMVLDQWESVGPGKGVFLKNFGGFVDPNTLMIDKTLCWECVSLWNFPLGNDPQGMSADRNIFNYLKGHSEPGETGKGTVFYRITPGDSNHQNRMYALGNIPKKA